MARDFSDPEMEARLIANSQRQGFNNWFGVTCVAAGNGQVEVEVKIRPEHRQHHGYVHRGCVSSLADTACAWAAATAARADVVTSSFTFHFLKPASGDGLRAMARTVRAGRTQATVEVQVHSETEGLPPVLCGTGLATIAVLPARAAA
mgnify:CR=1 FL=1